MTLLRVGFMLDEDLLGRKSGVGICFGAYLSNINPLLFFFFLRGLCYLLFLLSFVEQQHLQDYNSTMARSFAQRREYVQSTNASRQSIQCAVWTRLPLVGSGISLSKTVDPFLRFSTLLGMKLHRGKQANRHTDRTGQALDYSVLRSMDRQAKDLLYSVRSSRF